MLRILEWVSSTATAGCYRGGRGGRLPGGIAARLADATLAGRPRRRADAHHSACSRCPRCSNLDAAAAGAARAAYGAT